MMCDPHWRLITAPPCSARFASLPPCRGKSALFPIGDVSFPLARDGFAANFAIDLLLQECDVLKVNQFIFLGVGQNRAAGRSTQFENESVESINELVQSFRLDINEVLV